MLLFRKKIERSCAYCAKGTVLDNGSVLCSKRGYMMQSSSCLHFRYDPCKRVPYKVKALDFSKFSDRDFTLE